MFGTKSSKNLRFSMLMMVVLTGIPGWIFSVPRSAASAELEKSSGAGNKPPKTSSRPVPVPIASSQKDSVTVASTSSGYDHCVQDDTDPSNGVSFNSVSRAFICSSGGQILFSGTGTKSSVNGCTVFQGRSGNNSVTLSYSGTGCNTASATINYNYAPGLFKTIRVSDSNVSNDQCAVGPSVALLSPNGVEVLDVGSSFNIMWQAFDQSGVTSQDILLSTNGGSTFSNIVTGLTPTVTSYTWTVPTVANNTDVVVQVAVHDAAGVVGTAISASPFTIWNPVAAYTHRAEAPLYVLAGSLATVSGGGNNSTSLAAVEDSTVELCNESSNSVSVELALRERSGNVGGPAPVNLTLPTNSHKSVALSSLFAFTSDPVTFTGSIRLRHNGSSDADVRALILIDTDNSLQSVTVPFVYPASAQSSTGSVQYAPMYYIGGVEPQTTLALQNATNSPVTANLTLMYGDGGLAGSAGQLALKPITLYAQQTTFVDISQLASQLQGSTWGSIELNAPPQSVVGYVVSGDLADNMRFGCGFEDPAMHSQTSMTATGLSIDSSTGRAACLMVCNTSSNSRTVNLSYQSDSGVSIASSQLNLSPGQQQMIELTPSHILPSGGSTMADARISYVGNPGDIMAGAVSMSPTDSRAVPAQFVEASASDGRQLVAPFFWFDERVAGIVEISNLGASTVKAGVMMNFDDPTLFPLNTDLVSIPPGSTATLNLQNYFSVFEDGVTASGCLEVLHNGQPGTVVASFVALGVFSGIGLGIPLQGGPQFSNTDMALFPNQVDLGDDETSANFSAMTGASRSSPRWSVSSTSGSPGSIAAQTQTDPLVFPAVFTPPTDPSTLTVTVTADATGSGGPVKTAAVAVHKVVLRGFSTSAGHSRLSNTSPTTFTVTSKAGTPFPGGALAVRFKLGSNFVDATDVRLQDPNTLTGTAPTNNLFVKDCTILVLDSNGKKISKDQTPTFNPTGGPYYAYDPPGQVQANGVSPGAHDRSKVDPLTITGTGYSAFTPAGSQNTVFPTVFVGANLLGVSSPVTPTTITGKLPRNHTGEKACPSGVKCKEVTVGNPGHRMEDVVDTASAYELQPGPAPTIESISKDMGPSTGGTEVKITGTNLDFVNLVTLGGVKLDIEAGSVDGGGAALSVKTLPNPAVAENFAVTNVDNQSVTFDKDPFMFMFSPVMLLNATDPGPLPLGVAARYFGEVGPGEGVQQVNVSVVMTANGTSITPCVTPAFTATPIGLPDPRFPGVNSSLDIIEIDVSLSDSCAVGNPAGSISYSGTVSFQLGNTGAIGNSSLFTKKQSFNFFFNK